MYPALSQWQAATRDGKSYRYDHPLVQAACYEAAARDFDLMADGERCPRAAAVWRGVAAENMTTARRILATAQEARCG